MREISNIAVIGAGAIGASFAARFHKVQEFSTFIIAKGERYEKLINYGITVNRETLHISVVRPDEATTPADLIIVGLKHNHLKDALEDMKNFVADHTVFLSLMNGLDSEEIIGSAYGIDKMLYCIAVEIDALREGDAIVYTNPGKLCFGHPDNTQISDKVRSVQIACERAGVKYETPVDMIRTLWWKFMINVGVNQSSAIMRAPYGIFQTVPEAWAVATALMLEVIAVAKQTGVNLDEKDIDAAHKVICTLSPVGKTSMLQDMDAYRKTEVDIFAGKVVELGHKYEIPTPVNEIIMNIIRTLEKYPVLK
jgi:2-dehydropantoate 2-reductase